jgi:Cu/Ag efflux protein CusF
MREFVTGICFVASAVLAWSAAAQTGGAVVGKGPGVAAAAQTVKVTATITAIDPAARTVTLKGPKGREVTMTVGPEVKNFAQMKVGDQVEAEYAEALTLELKKGGGAAVARTEDKGMATAKPGERPAGLAARQVKVVADVVAVDPAAQTVTLKGPKQTLDLKVTDPEQLKLVKVGDQVEATYTEALAIAVQPVAGKK